ncbi:hypothetical protein ES703_82709 [subsurface metagenome]
MYFASENCDKTGAVYRMNNWQLENVCEKGENFYCHQIFEHNGELRAIFNYHNGNREIYTYLWGSPNGDLGTWRELAILNNPLNFRAKAVCSWKGEVYGAGYLRDDPSGRQAGILVKQNGSAFDTIHIAEGYPFDGLYASDKGLLLGGYAKASIWLYRGSPAPICVFERPGWWSIERFTKVGNFYYAGGEGERCAVVLRSSDAVNWTQYKDLHGNAEVRGMCPWVDKHSIEQLAVVCGRSGSDNAWIHDPGMGTWQVIGFPGETTSSYFSCGVSSN